MSVGSLNESSDAENGSILRRGVCFPPVPHVWPWLQRKSGGYLQQCISYYHHFLLVGLGPVEVWGGMFWCLGPLLDLIQALSHCCLEKYPFLLLGYHLFLSSLPWQCQGFIAGSSSPKTPTSTAPWSQSSFLGILNWGQEGPVSLCSPSLCYGFPQSMPARIFWGYKGFRISQRGQEKQKILPWGVFGWTLL